MRAGRTSLGRDSGGRQAPQRARAGRHSDAREVGVAMTIQRSIAAFGAGLALLPVAVLAHAHLDHASPAVGSMVAQPPKEVSIWFTEALEAKFSTIEVRDAQGTPAWHLQGDLARAFG